MAEYNILTIEEYCKNEDISDSGARKRVKQKKVKSAIIDEELHILIPSNKNEIIKDLKHKITLKNKTIQSLRTFKKSANSEAEKIERLENKIDQLHKEHREDLIKTIQGSIAVHNQNAIERRG